MSEHVHEFPCSRMDLPRMERWFEKQAARGRLISRLSMGLGNGVFDDIVGRPCHFCVKAYNRRLDEATLKSADFKAFRENFEGLGWTFQCGLMNLAVFCSEADHRPSEPPEDWEETRERLLRVTKKAERKHVLTDVLWSGIAAILAGNVLFNSRYRYAVEAGFSPELFAVVLVGAISIIFFSLTAYRAVPYLHMSRALRAGIISPERPAFWNRWCALALCCTALAAMQMIVAWCGPYPVMMGFCWLTATSGLASLVLRFLWHQKARPSGWERPLLWLGLAVIVLLGCSLVMTF